MEQPGYGMGFLGGHKRYKGWEMGIIIGRIFALENELMCSLDGDIT